MPNGFQRSDTQFGEMMQRALIDKQMSLKELATACGASYEYCRRLCNGSALPSKGMLALLCPILGLDVGEAQRLVEKDKLLKKFGNIPLELTGADAGLETVRRAWSDLSALQREGVLFMIDGFQRGNKRQRMVKSSAAEGQQK